MGKGILKEQTLRLKEQSEEGYKNFTVIKCKIKYN